MKLPIFYILLLEIGIVICTNDDTNVEIKEIIYSIENILNFVDKYYFQMNLDGVLGITLAEGKFFLFLLFDV